MRLKIVNAQVSDLKAHVKRGGGDQQAGGSRGAALEGEKLRAGTSAARVASVSPRRCPERKKIWL